MRQNILSDSLYTLSYITNLISSNLSTIDSLNKSMILDRDTYSRVFNPTINWNLILINSFLEEYETYFMSDIPIEKERILKVKRKSKPAIVRLDKWKDLRKFRNCVLTHPFRDQKNNYNSVLQNGALHEFDIPNKPNEFRIVSGMVIITCANIRKELDTILANLPPMRDQIKRFDYDIQASNREVKRIMDLVNT